MALVSINDNLSTVLTAVARATRTTDNGKKQKVSERLNEIVNSALTCYFASEDGQAELESASAIFETFKA